ncbi:FMRFamide receptor-like [Brachionus plicatilis]|uniref:FMRFamide receptor-like n=1 Tax=Brachionus plicatilis TaxID=10195 RepID=A0A3M7T4Y0_BRAPC|nr:FMRFamide receptor-like [Brachionus plicatilis]
MSNETIDEYISRITAISDSISFYYLLVIIPFGFFANILSIFIYTRPTMNKETNTSFLYMCLSIMNIISLLNYTFIVRPRNIFGYTVEMTCGLTGFIRRNIFNSTSWVQPIISFDRFLFVFYPVKCKQLGQKKNILFLMSLVLALIMITNSTNLMSFAVVETTYDNDTNQTVISESCEQTKQVSLATDFIAILMRLYIPLFIMISLNSLVIRKLYQSKKKVKKSSSLPMVHVKSSKSLSQKTFSNKDYKFITATLTMDFIFWIFYAPVSINITLSIIDTFTGIFKDPRARVNYRLYSNVSQLFAFTYHSICIFLFIGFNRYYKEELFSFLKINYRAPFRTSRTLNDSKTRSSNSVGQSVR